MSTGGKVALGIGVAAAVGGAFYYVMKQRQAMLAGGLSVQAVPTGLTSGYSVAGTYVDGGGTPVPSIAMVAGVTLPALQAAQAVVAAGPTTEARAGRAHF